MPVCSHKPGDKQAFGKAVGNELLKRHGKRRYYSPQQVRSAVERAGYPLDFSCWGMAMYTEPVEFSSYHEAAGEACDYVAMKAEMFSALTDGASASWFDVDMSWLDWPDIDLTAVFDFIDA